MIKRLILTLALSFIIIQNSAFAGYPTNNIFNFLKLYSSYLKNGSLTEEQVEEIRDLAIRAKSLELYKTLISLLVQNGYIEDAIDLANEAKSDFKDSFEPYLILGRLYLRTSNLKEAKKNLLKAIKLNKKSTEAYIHLATIYMEESEFKKALDLLKKAERIKQDADIYYYKGLIYRELNLNERAKKEFEKAIAYNPNLWKAYIELAELYESDNDFKKSIEIYEDLLRRHVISLSIISKLLNAYIHAGYYEKAIELGERLRKHHTDNIKIYEILCFLYIKVNKPDKVLTLVDEKKSKELIPFKLAAEIIKGTKVSPSKFEDIKNALRTISILMEAGFIQQAAEAAILSLVEHSKNKDIYFILSLIYEKAQSIKRAIKNAKIAFVLSPDTPKYAFNLGVLYEKAEEFERAIKFLKEAIRLDEENSVYLNYLGYLLIAREIDVRTGINFVKKALNIDPDNPSYMDSLAWGYFKLGRFRDALELQKKAYKKNQNNPVIIYHLAEIYYRIGEKEKAKQLFKKAIEYLRKHKDISGWEEREIIKRARQLNLL